MTTQHDHASTFAALHVKGEPLILFNIWDAGSAAVLQEIGAKAIATGSWSVAAAHGYEDGEQIPLDMVLFNLRRIVQNVNLPVSLDFEGCYGRTPDEVYANVGMAIESGAVGINFEDQVVGAEGLYAVEAQQARIAAARRAADDAGIPLFINARTDIFLKTDPGNQTDAHLEEAVRRAAAYADAGASGFFAPGLGDAARIETLCSQVTLPVNIMMLYHGLSGKELAVLGVARLSYGPGPYRQMLHALKDAGREALALH